MKRSPRYERRCRSDKSNESEGGEVKGKKRTKKKHITAIELRVELRQHGSGWTIEWWQLTKRETVKKLPNAPWGDT